MSNSPESIGVADSRRKERFTDAVCFLADQIISIVLVGPLTVFAWWGTWGFLNTYMFPDRLDVSGFVCFALGNGGLITLAFTQGLWKRYLSVDNVWHWVFGYHFYTALCFFCNVFHWRGLWTILDYYTGFNAISVWVTYAIGQGMLWIFRSSKSAQAPPMIIVYDREHQAEHFNYSTRFRTKPQLNEKYVFDVIFTVVIIHQLVVFYWRGCWEVMDLYIFPDNKTYSAVVSFGIAVGLLILVTIIQPLFNFLYRRFASAKNSRHRFLCSWLLEAVSYFFSNLINVGLWRGVWLICDAYVLPDRPDVAHGVILVAGFAGLWLMLCGHSVAIRGCDIDGDTNGDEDAIAMCPNLYIRRFRQLRNSSVLKFVPDSQGLENQTVPEQSQNSSVPSFVMDSESQERQKVLEHNDNGSVLKFVPDSQGLEDQKDSEQSQNSSIPSFVMDSEGQERHKIDEQNDSESVLHCVMDSQGLDGQKICEHNENGSVQSLVTEVLEVHTVHEDNQNSFIPNFVPDSREQEDHKVHEQNQNISVPNFVMDSEGLEGQKVLEENDNGSALNFMTEVLKVHTVSEENQNSTIPNFVIESEGLEGHNVFEHNDNDSVPNFVSESRDLEGQKILELNGNSEVNRNDRDITTINYASSAF